MELCLALKITHPRQLFRRLPWRDFLDWAAMWEVSPWGDSRADGRLFVQFWAALAPHISDPGPVPSCVWPYIETESGLSEPEVIAQTLALRAMQEALTHG